jgi:hypothetical protein
LPSASNADEAHAVAVERQLLALVEDQVGLLVERDLVLAEQQQLLLRADALELLGYHVRIDAVRPLALEPHSTALSVPCRGLYAQRTEQFGAHARDTGRMPRSSSQRVAKRAAARIGPTVCDDDGQCRF